MGKKITILKPGIHSPDGQNIEKGEKKKTKPQKTRGVNQKSFQRKIPLKWKTA